VENKIQDFIEVPGQLARTASQIDA